MKDFDIHSYSYILPDTLIAQEAVRPHHDARLIVCDRTTGVIEHEGTFRELSDIISENRVLFFNNSRVLRARIPLRDRGIIRHDNTHGSIKEGEILFCEKTTGNQFGALVRPGSKFKIGTKILFGKGWIEVISHTEAGRILETHEVTIESLMEEYGELPLPPYIAYSREKEADYQTRFARVDGSVAAPTASLHFTDELLENIGQPKEYVTLHVGLGTFKGIDVADIRDYQIHGETVEIEFEIFQKIARYKNTGNKLIAVGTTVCRTLESLPFVWKGLEKDQKELFETSTRVYWEEITENLPDHDWIHNIHSDSRLTTLCFSTSIYITPGYVFRIIDELITNFHLPESSLLVLVSAFMGRESIEKIYSHAIREKYRFFSFGDGMYIRGRV